MAEPNLQKVMMVEDETDIQLVAKMALEAVGGFSVEICSNGTEAIGTAPVFRPDLILLDVMMPGMDGPTTLSELRKIAETSTTPVIFMTAKVQPHEISRYKELGAIDVISKPFDPMTLSASLKQIWLQHQNQL